MHVDLEAERMVDELTETPWWYAHQWHREQRSLVRSIRGKTCVVIGVAYERVGKERKEVGEAITNDPAMLKKLWRIVHDEEDYDVRPTRGNLENDLVRAIVAKGSTAAITRYKKSPAHDGVSQDTLTAEWMVGLLINDGVLKVCKRCRVDKHDSKIQYRVLRKKLREWMTVRLVLLAPEG